MTIMIQCAKNIKRAINFRINKERILQEPKWIFVSEFLNGEYPKCSTETLIEVLTKYCEDDYYYNCGWSCKFNKHHGQLILNHDDYTIAYGVFDANNC